MTTDFKLKQILSEKGTKALPKGEVWLGSKLFERAGLQDTAQNHLHLAKRLGQDLVCLPICSSPSDKPDLGYRYFTPQDLSDALKNKEKPFLAVIDGPFQEMVNKVGLMQVLMDWIKNPQKLNEIYGENSKEALTLIRACLDQGVDGIIVADDFSTESAPLVNPADIDNMCRGFYTQAVDAAHDAGAPLLLHCCGNLSQLITLFKTWQLDGFAAIQSNINDLIDLYEKMGANVILMAGIESVMLENDPPPQPSLERLRHVVDILGATGNFVLGSSCGLYDCAFLKSIQSLYAIH